jgi:prepilin-type N-terminal cleavage/methylation domain-containing protein
MTALGRAVGRCRPDDGFTLVETLIALMILGISSGLLVQSVALATSQIRTSKLAEDAELLAVSLLAESAAKGVGNSVAEGVDPVSGLYWRVAQEQRPRIVEEVKRASVTLISIEVRTAKSAAPLFELPSASMEADGQ